jgi:hypothetical protein
MKRVVLSLLLDAPPAPFVFIGGPVTRLEHDNVFATVDDGSSHAD